VNLTPATGAGVISVGSHQYLLVGGTLSAPPRPALGNGLVTALAPPGEPDVPGRFAVVHTGTDTGPVRLTIDLRGDPPSGVDEGWDEIAEISLDLALPGVVDTGVDDPGAQGLPALPPGPIRLRVHARGRDAASVTWVEDDDPLEEHLIVAWPADPAEPVVIRQTDAFGAALRASAALYESGTAALRVLRDVEDGGGRPAG
jgi:hypothetical protein